MPSLQAIGRQIEADNRQAVANEATSYRGRFWRNPFQRFGYWLTELIPAIRRGRAGANATFLKLIQEYKPQIVAQYKEYAEQFWRWEQENRQYGCGSSDAIEQERFAAAEAKRLTSELQEKLGASGWCYRNLPQFNELVYAYEGYLRTDAVQTYWNAIEQFIAARTNQ